LDMNHKEDRFDFGKNWSNYLSLINSERISRAEESLVEMFELKEFKNKSFLDIGCGSGIFSLAARNLGATVLSFDYDPKSVECARSLKKKYCQHDGRWEIESGSMLDKYYIERLGKHDLVYCWGVAHHTGDMFQALENLTETVKTKGQVLVAIYNSQGSLTKYWTFIKRWFVRYPIIRPILIAMHAFMILFPSMLLKKLRGQKIPRGMSAWYDLLDWLGGYPFETSTASGIFEFFKKRGFRLEKLKTVGGKMGCNEFVFRKIEE